MYLQSLLLISSQYYLFIYLSIYLQCWGSKVGPHECWASILSLSHVHPKPLSMLPNLESCLKNYS
jgi:hypothetical protein